MTKHCPPPGNSCAVGSGVCRAVANDLLLSKSGARYFLNEVYKLRKRISVSYAEILLILNGYMMRNVDRSGEAGQSGPVD